jgi:hypothetical protein
LGSPSFREFINSCLSFPTKSISLKWSSRTLDIVKNLVSVQTVTVQCLGSNSWTVTIQCLDGNGWTVTVGQYQFYV